ncbi:MAG: M56 family metallopeptidase [Chitinophagaceae bacterium]
MQTYVLNHIVLSALFALGYQFCLARKTCFTWNRYYLIASVLFSIFLPLLSISMLKFSLLSYTHQPSLFTTLHTLYIYGQSKTNFNPSIQNILFCIYIAGLLFYFIKSVSSFVYLYVVRHQAVCHTHRQISFYVHEKINTPFSFLQFIFLPKLLPTDIKTILLHEKLHIQKRHYIDKLLFLFVQHVFWFNPILLFYQKELALQHEYAVDHSMLYQIDKDTYIKQLLHTISHNAIFSSITLSLYHPPLKKRITMMYNSKSQNGLYKIFSTAALCLVFLLYFSLQSAAQSAPSNTSTETDTVYVEKPDGTVEQKIIQRVEKKEAFQIVEQMPEFPGGENALMDYLVKNLNYPKYSKKKGIEGRVMVGFIISSEGEVKDVKILRSPDNGKELEAEAMRVIKNMPKWRPGYQNGKAVNVQYRLPILFSRK